MEEYILKDVKNFCRICFTGSGDLFSIYGTTLRNNAKDFIPNIYEILLKISFFKVGKNA